MAPSAFADGGIHDLVCALQDEDYVGLEGLPDTLCLIAANQSPSFNCMLIEELLKPFRTESAPDRCIPLCQHLVFGHTAPLRLNHPVPVEGLV